MFAALITMGTVTSSDADIVLIDDFEDQNAIAWRAFGDSEPRLITKEGNVLLQLAPNTAAVRSFSTLGYGDVKVSVSLAAKQLTKNDFCVADVLVKGEEEWKTIGQIWKDQDDGKTMYIISSQNESLDNQESITIRVRNTSTNYAARCWADNITVTAAPLRRLERKTQRVSIDKTPFLMSQLLRGDMPSLKHMSAFALPADARQAIHTFQGQLHIDAQLMNGFLPLYDRLALTERQELQTNSFPSTTLDLIQAGDSLIPVRRGLQKTDHPFWGIIVQPGQVWSQGDDEGYSRAALPIALVEGYENCTHHGVMIFLYNNEGKISQIAFQFARETCADYQVNMWGMLKGDYTQRVYDNQQAIVDATHDEFMMRLPSKPLQELEGELSPFDAVHLSAINDGKADYSAISGLIIDGVHYQAGCQTRAGLHPYCDEMALPSYALSHALIGGFASMMLAHRYPDLSEQQIMTYIPACAVAYGWENVTFSQTLNMTTGHFDLRAPGIDESSAAMLRFFLMDSHFGKTRLACNQFYRQANPGYVWVYQSSTSYLLGAALNAFYQEQNGEEADLYNDLMLSKLWRPLGMSRLLETPLRTADPINQAYTYNGLWMTPHDVARLGDWLQHGKGQVGDRTLLDDYMFAAAMQRVETDRGSAVGHAFGADRETYRYKNAFYARNVAPLLGCPKETWVPFLSSETGSVMMLFPNGITYYRFSDVDPFVSDDVIQAIHRLRPLCST